MSLVDLKGDIIWKVLSVGLFPALLWVNSISNDMAVVNSRLSIAEDSIKSMGDDIKEVSKTTTANAVKLEAIQSSLDRLHQSITETRADLRAINTRLLGARNNE
jgi:septal ring factor EnvC (AmiA/AmiB activator)